MRIWHFTRDGGGDAPEAVGAVAYGVMGPSGSVHAVAVHVGILAPGQLWALVDYDKPMNTDALAHVATSVQACLPSGISVDLHAMPAVG